VNRSEQDLQAVLDDLAADPPAPEPVLHQMRVRIRRRRRARGAALAAATVVAVAAALTAPGWLRAADRTAPPTSTPSTSAQSNEASTDPSGPAEICAPLRGTRVPFRLAFAPPGTRATGRCIRGSSIVVPFERNGQPNYGEIAWGTGTVARPEPPDLTVDGHPAWLGPSSTFIELDGCYLIVTGFVADVDVNRQVALALNVTPNCKDQTTWYDGSALPGA
jgi:hypothetical protein